MLKLGLRSRGLPPELSSTDLAWFRAGALIPLLMTSCVLNDSFAEARMDDNGGDRSKTESMSLEMELSSDSIFIIRGSSSSDSAAVTSVPVPRGFIFSMCFLRYCFFFSARSRRFRWNSSSGIGTPLQVDGGFARDGLPGPLCVWSIFRCLARRFWNQVWWIKSREKHYWNVIRIILFYYFVEEHSIYYYNNRKLNMQSRLQIKRIKILWGVCNLPLYRTLQCLVLPIL